MTRIAYLVTSAREMTLADGSQHPTGYFAEEALKPYERFVAAGFRVLVRLFGRNVRKAAEDVVFVATDPSLDRVTGEYFRRRQQRAGSPSSRDSVTALRLYEACAQVAKPFA